MKFVTRKDQLGNVIGYDRVSDDGTILESSNTNEAVAQPTPLPGERVALPTMSGDFRSSAERRADEAVASKASESGDEDGGGYNIPKSVLNEMQGSSGTSQESAEPKEEFKRTPEGQAMFEENQATDARLASEREEGGLRGAFAGFQQLGRNAARSVIDAAEDFSDFGAAVIDTVRGKEVNNDDNWFNPSARVTEASSTIGKIGVEIGSFAVSAVTVGGILGKVPTVAKLAAGGWKARAAYSAGTGAVTDFIKAKEGEETLSNAIQGTPLANSVTKFLAADTDEDANLWLNKTKATIEGSVLGLGTDLFGAGLTAAFRKAKIEPMERLMVGLRNAKKLPDDQQVDAMKALDVEVAETVEKTQQLLLKASEDIQGSVITDARRLLKAAPEPTRKTVADTVNPKVSTIDVDNLPKVGDPTIVAGGTKGPEAYIERLELLEEEITKVSDLKLGIFEMGIGADTQQLDDILFELSDELEAVESAVKGLSSPLPDAFDISPERADLISKLEGPRITPEDALGDARTPEAIKSSKLAADIESYQARELEISEATEANKAASAEYDKALADYENFSEAKRADEDTAIKAIEAVDDELGELVLIKPGAKESELNRLDRFNLTIEEVPERIKELRESYQGLEDTLKEVQSREMPSKPVETVLKDVPDSLPEPSLPVEATASPVNRVAEEIAEIDAELLELGKSSPVSSESPGDTTRFKADNSEIAEYVRKGSSVSSDSPAVKRGGPNTPEDFFEVLAEVDAEVGGDNYTPIYKMRERYPEGTLKEFHEKLYELQRSGDIELSTLHDTGSYTSEQLEAGILRDNRAYLFFIEDLKPGNKPVDTSPTSSTADPFGGFNYKPKFEDDTLTVVDIDRVYDDWQKNGLTDLVEGRREALAPELDKLKESGEALDAPELTYSDKRGFDIRDGRTRITELKERGVKYIKAVVDDLDKEPISSNTDKIKELQQRRLELEELEIDSLPPEEYLAKYKPDELRSPQEPPKVTVEEGSIGEAARFDGPGATPDRTANIIGGKPSVVEGRVGQPQGRYRTKPEIRRDIAEKTVAKRMAPEAPIETPKSPKGKSSNPKSVEAVEVVSASTRKAARAIGISPDELKNNLLGRSKGEPVGRFMNMDKLTDSEAVSDAAEAVMKTLEDSQITAKLTDGQLQRRASNLVNGLKFIDDKTADKVLEAYAGITSNVPAAQQAIRMMAEDMGEQLVEAANRVGLNKKVNDLTIDDLASDTDLAYKLSRFQYFLGFNKNLGSVQAQGFRARGLKVTPDEVANRLAKANYEKSKGLAKAATEDPQQMTDAILKALRTPEGRKKFAAVKADLTNAESLEDIANATKWARMAFYGNKTKNMLLGIRMNNILSGTGTNLTNVVSNGTMALYVPATQAAGAMIDMPYRILRGDKAGYKADKKAMAEALGMYSGFIQYLGDSSQMARKAFKAGKGIIGEDQLAKEVADISQLQPLDGPLNIATALSHTLTMPSRLLVTGDEFFKQLNYRAFVSSQATQEGIEKGLKGKKLKEYAEGMLNKSFKIDDNNIQGLALDPKGKEYAEFVTFQSTISKETSKYREGAVGIVRKLNETPVLEHLTPLFVPFIKTPANIMAYTGRNSPLALLSKSWQADYAAGGAKRAQAIGEFAMGSTALGGIMSLALSGKLTGRPPVDKGEREQWYAQGYQPYSIRVGNSWVSFQRMEPFAGHFGIVADMVNATSRSAKEDKLNLEDTQAHILGSFVSAVRNRTFFEGLSDLTDLIGAIGSTDSRDANTITNVRDQIAATLVPYSSALNEQRRARDLTLREAEGLVEIVMNKIPGMSKDLPAQRNWLTGKPIEYQSNPILNLYPSSAMKNDPLIKKLLKYNVPLNPPDKTIKGGVEISNKQYSDLLALTGQIEIGGMTQYQAITQAFDKFDTSVIDAELDYIQAHDEYARQSPLSVAIGDVRSAYAKAAESALVQANPELLEQVRTNLTEKGSVKEGMFWMNSPLFEETGYAPGDDPVIDETTSDINSKVNKSLKGLVEGAGPTSVDDELIQ